MVFRANHFGALCGLLCSSVLAVAILNCSKDRSADVSTPDKSAPSALMTQPYDGEQDVEIDDSILIVFSESINCASVDSTGFSITPRVSYSIDCRRDTILMFPRRPLLFGAVYTATVSSVVTDLSGNPLGQTYSWSFTTRDARPTEQWRIVSVQMIGSGGLTDVASSGIRYVAVGGLGAVAFSDDGSIWNPVVPPSTASIFGVAWADTFFVAVGDGDLILTSTDGIDWVTRRTGSPTRGLRAVAASDNLIVTVGDRQTIGDKYLGAVCISHDGVDWDPVDVEIDCRLSAVTWNGHTFVAVGYRGDGTVTVWLSESGAEWALLREQVGFQHSRPNIASHGDTIVIVAGKEDAGILYTPNLVSWSIRPQPVSNGLYDVTFTGDRFVAIGSEGTAISSPDGINWTSHDTGTSYSFWGVAGTKQQIAAVGGAKAMISP